MNWDQLIEQLERALEDRELLTAAQISWIEQSIDKLNKLKAESHTASDATKTKIGRNRELAEWIRQNYGHPVRLPEGLANGLPFEYAIPVEIDHVTDRHRRDEWSAFLENYFDQKLLYLPMTETTDLLLISDLLLRETLPEDAIISRKRHILEEGLTSMAEGLHEVVLSEWDEQCHITVSYPIHLKGVFLPDIARLAGFRELGMRCYPGQFVHSSWKYRVAHALELLPEEEKRSLMRQVFKDGEPPDGEMLATLDAFWSENGNVSDTARRLYIHRNTLLYRLDRFKQETGYDVRSFEQAMLVRMALLLYKMTNN